MRNPRRWRDIALGVAASGLVTSLAAFLLPVAAAGDTARGVLFIYGLTAVLLGGGTAVFRHRDLRAQEALARGERVMARWHVDAGTWREFLEDNEQRQQEDGALPNELSIPATVPAGGVAVIAGEIAVQIGDSIHALPRRDTPEVTHAELNTSRVRPSFIELRLYYPGGGTGASGVPRPPLRTVLRFPVPREALRDAERVVAYYAAGRPGEADFFHGRGDGTDPEDLSTCFICGYATHKLASHCPQCGAPLQSRRWSRRFGAVLSVCGLFITAVMGTVLYYAAPLMLRPGVRIGSTRFTGTAAQGLLFLGIMGAVLIFGVTALLYGLWQIKSGGRDKRVIFFIVGLAALLGLIVMGMWAAGA